MRAVITPNGRFGSVREASIAHGITSVSGKQRVEHNVEGWRYDDSESAVVSEWKKFVSLNGGRRSERQAFIAGYEAGLCAGKDGK